MNFQKKVIKILPNILFSLLSTSCSSSSFLWKIDSSVEEKEYTVYFYNDDIKIEEKKVKEGNRPTYSGLTPYKTSSDSNTYYFIGWSTTNNDSPNNAIALANLPVVKSDVTYYAVYKAHSTTKYSEISYSFNVGNKIELDYRGSEESAFSNTQNITLVNSFNAGIDYTLSYTLDDETNDLEFFDISLSEDKKTINITATKESRYTTITVVAKNSASETLLEDNITLLSDTTNFAVDDTTIPTQIGENTIDISNLTGLNLTTSTANSFNQIDGSKKEQRDANQKDFVIPSKYIANGTTKEVAYLSYSA